MSGGCLFHKTRECKKKANERFLFRKTEGTQKGPANDGLGAYGLLQATKRLAALRRMGSSVPLRQGRLLESHTEAPRRVPRRFRNQVAEGQNRFGIPFWLVGEFSTHLRTYSSGDWDAHCGYGVLTHGQVSEGQKSVNRNMDPWQMEPGTKTSSPLVV